MVATIEDRKNKAGTVISHRVKWRHPDTGTESATFAASHEGLRQAKDCKKLVERLNHIILGPEAYADVMGTYEPDAGPEELTLGEWYEKWTNLKEGIQESTAEGYDRHYRTRIKDVVIDGRKLGEYPLSEITREVLAKWVRAVPTHAKPIGPTTVRRHYATFRQIMRAAHAHSYIDRNPAQSIEMPKATESDDTGGGREQVFLTKKEAERISVEMPGLYGALFDAFLGTGCRWSELTAVRVCDVTLRPASEVEIEAGIFEAGELVPNVVAITRAWKRSKTRGWYIGPPKSVRSRRKISLASKTARVFASRMKGLRKNDLIFSIDHSSRLGDTDATRHHLQPALDKVKLDKSPRWHDLRHTHASWLIAAKVPLPAIQRRLGHQSITTTIDTYGHLLPEIDDHLLSVLDDMLPE